MSQEKSIDSLKVKKGWLFACMTASVLAACGGGGGFQEVAVYVR